MNRIIPAELSPWLRLATEEDAADLAPRMRVVDREECLLLSGQTPLQALRSGLAQGLAVAFTHPETQKVHGMFGLALGKIIWLLADDAMFADPAMLRAMTRHGRAFLRLLFKQTDVEDTVFNLTLARNTRVLRWLEWLGATLTPPMLIASNRQQVVGFSFQRDNYPPKEDEPCAAL